MPADTLPLAAAGAAEVVGAWLLTYAVHSALLFVAVWLLTLRHGLLSHSLRDLLWKVVLLGGLVTASAQIGLGMTPVAGRLTLADTWHRIPWIAEPAGRPLPPPPSDAVTRFSGHPAAASPFTGREQASGLPGAVPGGGPDGAIETPATLRADDLVSGHAVLRLLLGIWIAGAGIALARQRCLADGHQPRVRSDASRPAATCAWRRNETENGAGWR